VVRGIYVIAKGAQRAATVLLGLVVIGAGVGIIVVVGFTIRDTFVQRSLDSFYVTAPKDLGEPGMLLRTEPMTVDFVPLSIPGGTAHRMLYTSALPDGTPVASSGMLFIPDSPAPTGSRPVLAWAHPTLGEGTGCAPSRSSNPLMDMQPWLTLALQRGWVVVATDYAGVGTAGTPLYLVGESEARDVLYAVQAARQVTAADAGAQVAIFGHSQGGHSALWTGLLADRIAPELNIAGVAAAAPAAELTAVFNAEWNGSQAWLLAPDVVASWTTFYPQLTDRVLTPFARAFGPRVTRQCITSAVVQAHLLYALGLPFTVKDPMQHPGWSAAAAAQTPPPLPADLPLLLIQSTTDQTIPPSTTADLQTNWCAAGSRVNALWLSGLSHIETATSASSMVIDWIADRFAGNLTVHTCTPPPPSDTPPPVPTV
jgi:pimeloyl-ACP methyl ester carboxylesterase